MEQCDDILKGFLDINFSIKFDVIFFMNASFDKMRIRNAEATTKLNFF